MAVQLPPIPNNPITDVFIWRDWFYKVSQALVATVSTNFVDLNFSGSNLQSIETRQHNALQSIQGGQGGQYYHLNQSQYNQVVGFFNYGHWYSTANQTFTATTATQINLDTQVSAVGMSLATNTITIGAAGVYNITYSIQLANTDSTAFRYADFWFRQNGTDIVGSASQFNVPNHHGSLDGYLVAMSNIVTTCAAGDTIQLWGAVETTGVFIEAYAAQTTPFAMPSIPGSILTIQQVA
jgi:hypothetical protein